MIKVDWSKAPDGAMRHSDTEGWLLNKDGNIKGIFSDTMWSSYVNQDFALNKWNNATPRPMTPNDIDTTITQRGERYGKFKDGSVIMQDLKNIMRETPNWEGLTPSQREALEMIQHKIGRILNGDPMYIDSWTDISGYSKLIADELNGAIR